MNKFNKPKVEPNKKKEPKVDEERIIRGEVADWYLDTREETPEE